MTVARAGMGPAPARPGTAEAAGDPNRALRRLVPYLKPYWPLLAVVLVTVVVGWAGTLLTGRKSIPSLLEV